MNTIVQLVLSTILLAQLGVAVPFQKFTSKGTGNRRSYANQIFNNYIDEYEHETQVSKSKTCAYFDYKDDCHNSNEGCGVQTETCSNDYSGCYAVWSGNVKLLQGCWIPSSPDCKIGACVAEDSRSPSKLKDEGTHFCCCLGDHCNDMYGLSNHIYSWP